MQGIFGLYPLAFFAILLIVGLVAAVIIYLYLNQRKRQENLDAIKGKLLCEFCSPNGAYTELCEEFKGQLKKVESKSRATFTVDRFINAPKSKGDQSIDVYYVLQDHCFPFRWPEGKPSSQQVIVMKTHYLVNDPIPKITYRPQDWSPEIYDRTTSAIAKYAQDEKTLQVLVSELAGVWKRIEDFVSYLKSIPMMRILLVIIILLELANAYMNYKGMSGTGSIISFLKGLGWK